MVARLSLTSDQVVALEVPGRVGDFRTYFWTTTGNGTNCPSNVHIVLTLPTDKWVPFFRESPKWISVLPLVFL